MEKMDELKEWNYTRLKRENTEMERIDELEEWNN